MGILKDWQEDTDGYVFTAKVTYFFSPKVWLRLHKWRKQRADRGWSDRDTWGAGEHIAQMTAEMLQYLNDETYVDWPEWFRLNVKEEGKGAYEDLQTVIDDINGYLEYSKTSWADGYTTRNSDIETHPDGTYKSPTWYSEKTGKPINDKKVRALIEAHHKKGDKLYKKANKAMGFFGRHFASFWD